MRSAVLKDYRGYNREGLSYGFRAKMTAISQVAQPIPPIHLSKGVNP